VHSARGGGVYLLGGRGDLALLPRLGLRLIRCLSVSGLGGRSIRYSLSVLVTTKRLSDFLLYKRSEQFFCAAFAFASSAVSGVGV